MDPAFAVPAVEQSRLFQDRAISALQTGAFLRRQRRELLAVEAVVLLTVLLIVRVFSPQRFGREALREIYVKER